MKPNFKYIFVFLFLALTMSFVSAHTININFYDENSLSAIPTVTITDANGSIYTSDVNGLWSVDLVGAKSFEISKTGYATRSFEFYFNADANYNFLLNPTGLDSNIGFIVKDSNNNLWTNKYLMFSKTGLYLENKPLDRSFETITNWTYSELDSYENFTGTQSSDWATDKIYSYKLSINANPGRTDNYSQILQSVDFTNVDFISFDYKLVCTYNFGPTYASAYANIGANNIFTKAFVKNTTETGTILYDVSAITGNQNLVFKIQPTSTGTSSGNNFYIDNIKLYLKSPTNIFTINSLLTSSSGTATASLLANGDYNALLYDATGTLVDTYEKTTVTVNKPKNEVTLADISPYDITVGGLLGYSLTNQSASSVSFNIFAGTEGFYYFSVVDYNAVPADRNYLPRQYFTQVPMGTGYESALTYQPYLLLETDAVVPKITVLDQLNKPIGDVDIFISRSISNVQTIVESGKTTSTGNMSFSAYPLEYYYINVIYNGVDKGTFRVQPRESSDNFIIVIDTSDDVVDTGELIITADFSGTPKVVNIDDTDINADITITQSLNQATSYNLYLIQNNVTKASTSGAISGLVTSIDYDFDSSVVDRFNNNLTLKLVVNYQDGNQTFYYTITATKNAKGLMYFAPQIINDIGQPLGIILAILITGIILATLTFSGLNISPTAITILGVLILGVFMFLGWLDTGITVLGFDIARFFYVLMAIAMIYFMMRGEQYA